MDFSQEKLGKLEATVENGETKIAPESCKHLKFKSFEKFYKKFAESEQIKNENAKIMIRL